MILVTGFEPFGGHPSNPSEEIAHAVDGRVVGGLPVRAAILPVHHVEAGLAARRLLHEHDPLAVLHVGLAAGRARIALERVAVNVMDYEAADNAGYQASGASRAGRRPISRRCPCRPFSMHSRVTASPRICPTRPARTSATRRSTPRSTP